MNTIPIESCSEIFRPVGSDIVTNQGRAKVLGQEILTSQLLIVTEDSRRVLIELDDVLTVLSKGNGNRRKDAPAN